jgi:hypothetical protein
MADAENYLLTKVLVSLFGILAVHVLVVEIQEGANKLPKDVGHAGCSQLSG